ncbi:hypothetical protein CARUB_v10014456mg [Capsella rubella]|uniref:Uncharacterized protein n=1 Tax=Capsella rubella TaxID=81985 RepID=R0G6N1_9BRAS|nr:uncharacterized protein LOC17893883 isoform X2 [Capsella rubella]EOA31277.1 hypothetical protein CARUB_v10014456mg [Capsella rubella]
MQLSLLQISSSSSSSSSSSVFYFRSDYSTIHTLSNSSPSCLLLQKSIFPGSTKLTRHRYRKKISNGSTRASLLETPVLWAGRICVFYALVKAGFAGSKSNPIVSGLESGGVDVDDDLGFSKWLQNIKGNKPEKDAADKRKLVSKWHPTTKGTLRRNYRVPSKGEGNRLLKAIASLLSDDDHFRDATSHKGCQIRRESAHGQSVCCNNVRALFDELPTPHLVVEITPFPAGPLTENDYLKAEKLERILRSGPNI